MSVGISVCVFALYVCGVCVVCVRGECVCGIYIYICVCLCVVSVV